MENNKLNIGIFCDSFFPMVDGVINVIDNYAKRLIEYANVTVFVPRGRDKKYAHNFPYKVVRCKKDFKCPGLDYDLPIPELDNDFMEELKNSKLDIVHIHSPFSIGKVGVKYAKKHKIPVVATCHSQFKKDFLEATKSKTLTSIAMANIMPTFEKCDECWAVNKEVAKLYHNEYKLKAPIKVKNNGTEMTFYENIKDVEKLRKSLNIAKDEKVLLFVGRLNVVKNIFFIADVLKLLKENNFKFKMIFVGQGPDEVELKKKIKNFDLEKEVVFTGRLTDRDVLAQYYQLADLFVFPSLYDCSSLVQIEAASQRTPTLFIRGAVTSGTCTEGEDAFFSNNSVSDYADKIIEIFSNKKEYQKICNGAFQNLYVSWDNVVENIYCDYLDVIEKYKQGHYKKLKKFMKTKVSATKKIKSKQQKLLKTEDKKTKNQQKIAKKQEKQVKKIKM